MESETAIEIPIKAPESEPGYSVTVPTMTGVPTASYAADENGIIHFPLSARAHADWVNELCRNADKAAATLAERKRLLDQRLNANKGIEDAIAKAVGSQPEMAAAVTAALMAGLPEIIKQIREMDQQPRRGQKVAD